MIAIFKKELKVYFTTVLGYVIMAIFLAIASIVFYFIHVMESGNSNFTSFFGILNSFLLVFVPIITLRIFVEDKKNSTFELLLTSPVSSWGIVIGKFLGVLTFSLSVASMLLLYPIFLSFFATVDWGTVISSYIGMFFALSFFVAIGMAASSITDNYVVAGAIALSFIIFFFLISVSAGFSGDTVSSILQEISFYHQYEQFAKGIIRVKNILYFIIGTFLFLYFAKDRVESSTWK